MKSNLFKRYELKYLITEVQYESLKQIMAMHMRKDKFFKTTNCNLYFDTPDHLLIRRSIEKPSYKEKLRLRSYGIPTPRQEVYIELKKKYDGIVYKRRIGIKEEDAMAYFNAGKALNVQNQISSEIDYVMKFYKDIQASMFLVYDRESYAGLNDDDFRMTFDTNILYREKDLTLTAGIYGTPILETKYVLMEVKTVIGLPLWLTAFLSENQIYKASFSKYGNAYKHSLLQKKIGGSKNVA
ncbi:MAG: polyphosphate polymerase domain-containing protein [Cellulosilyticaceae bacterium]